MTRLPLFPLPAVLFPYVPMPLHIFEERYRALVNQCLEEDRPFGITYHRGEDLRMVGCSAVIDRVTERYDDGRLDIVVVGYERFRIQDVHAGELFLEADVRHLPSGPERTDDGLRSRAVQAMLKYSFYGRLPLKREELEALTGEQLSYAVGSIDLIGMDTKQEILEIGDSTERLRRAVEQMEQLSNQLVAAEQIRRKLGVAPDPTAFWN